MSNKVGPGRFAFLLVATMLVSAACGNREENSAPEESVASSAGTALTDSGQDSDVVGTDDVDTDDEDAPVGGGDEVEGETRIRLNPMRQSSS